MNNRTVAMSANDVLRACAMLAGGLSTSLVCIFGGLSEADEMRLALAFTSLLAFLVRSSATGAAQAGAVFAVGELHELAELVSAVGGV